MALPEPFGGPSTGNREPPSYAGNASIAERNWLLLLAGLGELDFAATLDFGQDLIEPRVPGAGFQVGRRGAQTGDLVSAGTPTSPREKDVELARRAVDAGAARLVPLGP